MVVITQQLKQTLYEYVNLNNRLLITLTPVIEEIGCIGFSHTTDQIEFYCPIQNQTTIKSIYVDLYWIITAQ